jgi:serine/threonine protein kinase
VSTVNTASHPSLRNPPELPVLGSDRFEILEQIGAGGMGTVYKAIQKSVGRPVAVKVLSSEYAANAAGVGRFVREATVVSRLVHPNIVSMIEFGRDPEGNLLLVMELLEGEPLRQTLRRDKRLPPWRAVQIAMQVLAALRVAHGAGVVHRDLKPENIFITNVDGADHAKVLDFGVAKMLSHEVGHETTAGSLVGTLKYMAPEQIAGDPPDARVDLYALGVLLYEMLAGALPYEHKERVALLRAILNDPPVPLASRLPDLPQGLTDLVMRAISKLTIDRFQSADEFRAALIPYTMVGHGARAPAFQITQEIRLPLRAPTTDVDSNTRASTPNAISASGRRSAMPGDPSGAQAIQAPPPSLSGVSQSGLLVSSDVLAPSFAGGHAAPQTSPPDANYTTGAGLSSATHRTQHPPARRSALWMAVGATLIAGLAATVGVIAARTPRGASDASRGASGRNGGAEGTRDAVNGATSPSVGANGANLLVRTTPAGASVRDAVSGEVLCDRTPCMVPVAAGRQRRVRLALGTSSMEAVLDPAVSLLSVPLGPEPSATGAQTGTTVGTTVATTEADAGARRVNRAVNVIRRTSGNTGSRNGNANNNSGGDIPMFGVRPGGG